MTTALAGLMAGASNTAWAQAAAAPAATAPTATMAEVVVTGIRRSLAKSLQVKKASDDVVEVVTAESIGKFPDTNLAESLAHIPGVSVDRQFGEGDRVSIDGTDPALNRVFIDGHSIASADWGGDPQDTSSRNFNYSYLSPDIVSELKLYKNPEAWLDEGSVGGTTWVLTRKPLDLPANSLYASGGYSYNDRSAKGDLKASVFYSWKNESETFGIDAAYTHNEEHLTRAGIEYFGYSNGSDFLTHDANGDITGVANPAGMTINGAAPTAASEALLNAARYPAFINAAYFQQTRDRDGFQGTVTWKPLPTLEIDLSALAITGNYNNLSQSAYSYDVRTSRATAVTVANGLVESASYTGAPATGPGSSTWNGELDENYRVTAINNQTYDLAYKWDIDGFHITGDAGYTRATGGTRPEYLLNWRTQSGFTYNFNGEKTYLNYTNSPTNGNFWLTEYLEAVNSPSSHQQTVPGYNNGQPFTGFQVGGIGNDDYADGEVYGKADFEHDVSWGPFNKILFGGKYSTHENSDINHGDATYADVANGSFDVGTLGGSLTPTGIFNNLNESGNAFQFVTADQSQVIKEINSLPNKHFSLDTGSYFDVNEAIAAGYIEGLFSGDKYHGNIGVRVVNTDDSSKFFESADGGNTYSIVDIKHSYLKALPSFNFSYDASDKVVLRFGASEVIARPRYSDLAGATTVSVPVPGAIGDAGGGNPNLKPYDSYNYEGTAEWYFKPGSLLSGEIFLRDIQNYVLNVTGTTPVTLTNAVDGQTGQYYVSGPINAGKATVEGFALTYTWDIAYGFGIQTNYTFSSADTKDGYNMPYLSKDVINVIPYYEHGPYEARVSLNYRSQYFTDIGRLGSSDFTDAYREVDAQFAYHINKKISLTFNASNLLDETYYSFSGSKDAPTALYKNGRVFALSFTFRQ
jgi:iron complex outermembrane receptor protein